MITHNGVVKDIDERVATIELSSLTDCSGCKLFGLCRTNSTDSISVEISEDSKLKVGDMVHVNASDSMRRNAILLLLVFPLLIVFLVVTVSAFCGCCEWIQAIVALLSVSVYFISAYFFCRVKRMTVRWRIVVDEDCKFNEL